MQYKYKTDQLNGFFSSEGEDNYKYNNSYRARFDEYFFNEDDDLIKSTNDNPTTLENLRTVRRSCSIIEDHKKSQNYYNLH